MDGQAAEVATASSPLHKKIDAVQPVGSWLQAEMREKRGA
jgi:hypothetical protein